ncbi:MAG: hypothetical protein QOG08_148, partial [Chloroflexota bacterium]|nr:hypothetical protein [Chloroflexota bacterium]
RLIAHNLRSGINSVVLGLSSLSQSKSPTENIEDVWFASGV